MCQASILSVCGLSRRIATKNPFYVISAALVLYGLNRAVASGRGSDEWLLMSVMSGYTMLLALSGWLVVRVARVWDDARTLLLLIVLMFFAISVSLDHETLNDVDDAGPLLAFGLGFSVFLTELVLRSCRIALALRYRLPYYAMLGVLFVHPFMLGQFIVLGHGEWVSWGVCAFPAICGVAFLTLLPAAILSGHREPKNGTPWPWPLFPWSLFFFLAVGVLLRSYWLSIAFESNQGSGVSFRSYYVVPFLMAVCFVWLQAAHAVGSRWASHVGLLAPLVLLSLALPGPIANDLGGQFLSAFREQIASPAQLTAWLLVVFYAIAVLQRIVRAEVGLWCAILLTTAVHRGTLSLDTLSLPSASVVGVLAVVQCIRSTYVRSTAGLICGLLIGVLATCMHGHTTFYMAFNGVFPLQLAIASYFLAGLLFDDSLGRTMRRMAPWTVCFVSIVVAAVDPRVFQSIPETITAAFLAIICFIAALYWLKLRMAEQLLAVFVTAAVCAVFEFQYVYRMLIESPLAASVDWIAWGLIVLALALLITFSKSGLLANAWLRFLVLNRVLDRRWKWAS